MRLIDADDMLNMVDLLNDRAYSKKEIAAMINTRSTAYDIDKVGKILNTNSEMYQKYNYPENDYEVGFEQGCEYAFENAIEIVKQEVR